jgi:hypothetical protein
VTRGRVARAGGALAVLLAGVLTLLTTVAAPVPAAAAAAAPGLLDQRDLPSGFLPVVPATTISQPTALVTDPLACTQRLQPVPGAVDGSLAQFTPKGATNALPSVTELVLTYTDVAAATASFAQRRTSHDARLRCGTVQLLPPSSTSGGASPTTTLQYTKVKARFGGLGHDWFAEQSTAVGTIPYTALTFRSGPYVVGLTYSAGPGALKTKTLRSIATTAKHRLAAPATGS